ncbi:MAG: tRNA (adenosine(37)-N6)-dimethylallyltransferase MiaA [Methylococcaceae bacterium]|jgi:tRNA dimethylallyltransferase
MGPTASGKTRLAIDLAKALNGEIISVDSALVYQGMDIGTAKPSLTERQGIPHHLIDLLDPAEAYSTGRFRKDALQLIGEISQRGKLPILVGGTMLYFNALLNGLSQLPAADPVLRNEISAEADRRGWRALHGELVRIDPVAAARIHPNDPQRIQRALEVYRISGRTLTEWCQAIDDSPLPFRPVRLVLAPASRVLLHTRIHQRFLQMLEQGLVDEVRGLYERGDLHADISSMRAVGYRQVWEFLAGESSREQMIERGIIATRQFAKRQLTWLRKESTALSYVSDSEDLTTRVLTDIGGLLLPGA